MIVLDLRVLKWYSLSTIKKGGGSQMEIFNRLFGTKKSIGYLEFEWKMSVGIFLCNILGHSNKMRPSSKRCNRCLCPMEGWEKD